MQSITIFSFKRTNDRLINRDKDMKRLCNEYERTHRKSRTVCLWEEELKQGEKTTHLQLNIICNFYF